MNPKDLAKQFAKQWLEKATESDLATLKAQRPRIPQTLDVELLRFAEQALGISLRGQDERHRELRRSFWNAIARREPAG